MDYTTYSVEELASDESFIHWVNGTDREAEETWERFIALHPEMRMKLEQARTLVVNLRMAEGFRPSEKQVVALWQRIEGRIDPSEASIPAPGRRLFYRYAVAAAVALVVLFAAGWYALFPSRDNDTPVMAGQVPSVPEYIEELNTSGDVLRLHLSDGSTVTLAQGSRLKYKRVFGDDEYREVILTGEAYFEVAKDPSRPFLVHTDEVVTRVLGTSFRVKASEDNKEVVVSVRTGKVSVYAVSPGEEVTEAQKNGVVLLPNQQVTYLRDQDSFGKALVADPEIIAPSIKPSDFRFENTPIRKVFKVLQEAYGVEIIFDEEVMSNCYITAPLGSESLFEKLRIICRTIGAEYQTIDARVVITSAGC